MTKESVIQLIVNDKEYRRIANKITKGNDFANDLYQEFIIVMVEYSEAKLVEVQARGQLRFFCTGIMQRMYHNRNSPFNKQHRRYFEMFEDVTIPEVCEVEEEHIQKPKINIDLSADNFEETLLYLSVELGSVVEVSRRTGIHKDAIHKAIQRAKTNLKQKYEHSISNNP